MKGSPPLIKALLLTSLILTVGRGLTLPFLAIFLSQQCGMTPGQTGLVLGTSLMLAIVLSLYGGYLVDRFNKQRLILFDVLCGQLFLIAVYRAGHIAYRFDGDD